MKTGDLEPPWIVDISDELAAGDLTTVVSWKFTGVLNGQVLFTDLEPTVAVDPVNKYQASVQHAWVTGQTDDAGTVRGEITAVWPEGREQTFPGRGTCTLVIEPSL